MPNPPTDTKLLMGSDRPPIVPFVRMILTKIRWQYLAIPIVVTFVSTFFVRATISEGRYYKEVFEIVALVILFIGIGIAAYRYRVEKQTAFLWILWLLGILLFREFHLLKAASTIAIIALIILLGYYWFNFSKLSDYLASDQAITLIVMMFFCYVIAVVMDMDIVRERSPVYDTLEEIVECTGHFMVVVLAYIVHPQVGEQSLS